MSLINDRRHWPLASQVGPMPQGLTGELDRDPTSKGLIG